MNAPRGLALRWVALLVSVLPWAAGAGEGAAPATKFSIEGWTLARERKTVTAINRVSAVFTLKNLSDQALDGVTVDLTLFSGLGETVAGPMKQALGALRAQQARPVQLSATMVPVFGSYEIVIAWRGGREVWYGNNEGALPQPQAAQSATDGPQVLMLGDESWVTASGQFAGRVRVRNQSTLEANGLMLTVVFYAVGRSRQKVNLATWTGRLGDGRLPAGKDLVIPFVVPGRAPSGFAGYELKLAAADLAPERALAGGEFTNAKEVEAARWRFRRAGAKEEDLEVDCAVRNGLTQPVQSVRLALTFFLSEKGQRRKVKTHEHVVPGPLAPGAVAPVNFPIHAVPKYDSFEPALEFAAATPSGPETKPDRPAPAKADTVVVAFNEFRTSDDGTVLVSCVARNGRPAQVKDVVVTLRFLKADGVELCRAEKTLAEVLLTGEERRFVLRAPGAKGYARHESEVRFQELKDKAPPPP